MAYLEANLGLAIKSQDEISIGRDKQQYMSVKKWRTAFAYLNNENLEKRKIIINVCPW